MKKCPKCGETKPNTEFYRNVRARDGLQSQCKPCALVTNAESVAKYKANFTNWAWMRTDRYEANKSARLEAIRKKRLEYTNAWYVRRAENGGVLSKDIAERLFKLQRGKCACCGQPLGKYFHRDHIMPLALGGTNTDDNIQLLRARCNRQKNKKHPVDFMQQRGFLI